MPVLHPGQLVRLIGLPPGLTDDDDLQTGTLFRLCLGKTFIVESIDEISLAPEPIVGLNVGAVRGKPAWAETLYVEGRYLQPQV